MIRPFLPSEIRAPQANLFARKLLRGIDVVGRSSGGGADVAQIAKGLYPADAELLEHFSSDTTSRGPELKVRAATTPTALTTTNAPISTVVHLAPLLGPSSAIGNILQLAPGFDWGRAAAMSLPELAGQGISVAFIPENGMIPMTQLLLTATPMTPHKLGISFGCTAEVIEHTAAEAVIAPVVAKKASEALEVLFFDAVEGNTTRPGGLKYGISALAASASTGLEGMVADLANLAASVAPIGGTDIIFIAGPEEFAKIKIYKPDFPFPIFASAPLAGQVAALAVNALAVAGRGEPDIRMSKETTVLLDDAPIPLSAVGTPNTVAAPIRSAFQTDCVVVRLIADLTWSLRSASGFAWSENLNW